MRAVVHDRYGPPEVQRVAEVDRPAPGPGEVLVKVHATTVNRTDCGFRHPRPFFVRAFSGLRRPRHRTLGTEYAGEVAEVGDGVEGHAVGDAVFGVHEGFGAHAEYLCVKASTPIVAKPAALGHDEAAAVPDGFVLGLSGLAAARVGPGTRVLVYGASGSIGTAAVQIARHLGAHVVAVCNTANVDVVKGLGPDRVVDYEREDFTALGETFDLVLDAVGKSSYRRCRPLLGPKGIYISTDLGFLWQNPFLALGTALSRGRKVVFPLPKYSRENVELAARLVEAGEYRPVIDRRYPLDEVVEATRYVETEQKTGNVVLTVAPAPEPGTPAPGDG
jgi:NADPH:quinone reductase-like Zn-dependent oxidoreductase